MTPILEGDGISLKRGSRDVLARTCIALEPGRLKVMIGPNGAGKSTVLKLLSGELPPTSGRVLANGQPVLATLPWRLACIRAVLSQQASIAMPFTAREVVRLGCATIGQGLDGRARDALVDAALEQVDGTALAPRIVHTLSGGEQQRIHLARVLCQLAAGRTVEPHQALLLDEPIAALDLKHQIALLDHAWALSRSGLAVLIILHDMNLAAAYADELIVMARGTLVSRGTPREVLTDRVLRDTFDLPLAVRTTEPAGVPFILPPGPAGRP